MLSWFGVVFLVFQIGLLMEPSQIRNVLKELLTIASGEFNAYYEVVLLTIHVMMTLYQTSLPTDKDKAILHEISKSGGKVLASIVESDLCECVSLMLKAFTIFASSSELEVRKSTASKVKNLCFDILLFLQGLCETEDTGEDDFR